MRQAPDRPLWLATRLPVLLMASFVSVAVVRGEPAMTEVAALARPYGAGVHAYFSGDAQRAYEDFTQAIEAGTSDPRAWYFRGLAALKLGRLDEAEADFSTGADRETEAEGDWAVARSLERVQGRDRLALERHRVRARVAGLEQRRQRSEQRYSGIMSRQEEVQRERRPEGVSPDPVPKFVRPLQPERVTAPEPGQPPQPAEQGKPPSGREAEDAAEAGSPKPGAGADTTDTSPELSPARVEDDPEDTTSADGASATDAAPAGLGAAAGAGDDAEMNEKDAGATDPVENQPADGEKPVMAEGDAEATEKPADPAAAE